MRKSLLDKMTVNDIDLVTRDVDLLEKGFKILYCVDTYDIINYCFPYGLSGHNTSKEIDMIGDEQLAYNMLFENATLPISHLLFSEYKVEFLAARNKIHADIYKINELNRLSNSLETGLNHADAKEKEAFIKTLRSSLSFLLTYAKTRYDSVSRFSRLITTKLFFDDSISDNKDLSETAKDIIAGTSRSEWSKRVFQAWVDEHAKNEEAPIKGFADLENTLRDIMVIERIIRINKALFEAGQGYLILLFSSTPHKTQSIIEVIEKNGRTLPDIGYHDLRKRFEMPAHFLNRNISQAFLLSILWQNDKSKIISIKSTLQDLRTATARLNNVRSGLPPSYLQQFERVAQQAREEIERSHILQQIRNVSDTKQRIENLLDNLKRKKMYKERKGMDNTGMEEAREEIELEDTAIMQELIYVYKDLLKEAINQNADIQAELAVASFNTTSSVQEKLRDILNSLEAVDSMLVVEKGDDNIRGTYHHLPILLFRLDSVPNSNIPFNIFNVLIEFCISSHSQRKRILSTHHIKSLVISFMNDYLAAKLESSERGVERNLINIFVLLLTPARKSMRPAGGESQVQKNVNEEVYDFLQELYTIVEGLINDPQRSGFKKVYQEILYFYAWAARRCKKYDEALNALHQGIRKFPSDPRFVHGKCLVLYAKNYKPVRSILGFAFDQANLIQEMIGLASQAIDLYKKKEEASTDAFNKMLIRSSQVALMNLQAHCWSEIFKLEGHQQRIYLDEGRKLVAAIKKFETAQGRTYEEFPEYLHTESALEIQEAIYNELMGNNKQAKQKLHYAVEAISKAMKYIQSELYKGTKKEAEEKLRKILHAESAVSTQIPAQTAMLPWKDIVYNGAIDAKADHEILLMKDVLDFITRHATGNKLLIVDTQRKLRHLLTRDIVETYLAHTVHQGESSANSTLQDLVAWAGYTGRTSEEDTRSFVSEEAFLSDVYDRFIENRSCKDVFITANGFASGEIKGWITFDAMIDR